MLRKALFFALVASLAGCAETIIQGAEDEAKLTAVKQNDTLEHLTTLSALSTRAAKLSATYSEAASQVAQFQDVASVLVILSAGATVYGGVAGASETLLTKRALVGAGSTVAARRFANRNTIEGIYIGAKRLNCISTASALADAGAFPGLDSAQAVVATRGAIREVQITTREAVVREVENYKSLFDEITAAIPTIEIATTAAEPNETPLALYLMRLQKCLEKDEADSDEA